MYRLNFLDRQFQTVGWSEFRCAGDLRAIEVAARERAERNAYVVEVWNRGRVMAKLTGEDLRPADGSPAAAM